MFTKKQKINGSWITNVQQDHFEILKLCSNMLELMYMYVYFLEKKSFTLYKLTIFFLVLSVYTRRHSTRLQPGIADFTVLATDNLHMFNVIMLIKRKLCYSSIHIFAVFTFTSTDISWMMRSMTIIRWELHIYLRVWTQVCSYCDYKTQIQKKFHIAFRSTMLRHNLCE